MVFTRLTLFFPWNKESRFERGANEKGKNRTTLHKVGEPRQVISLCLDLTFSRVGISHESACMHVYRRFICFLGTVHSQEWQLQGDFGRGQPMQAVITIQLSQNARRDLSFLCCAPPHSVSLQRNDSRSYKMHKMCIFCMPNMQHRWIF